MSRQIIFRCDASRETGSGHVYRCLTLADSLIEKGWSCIFLSAPGSEDIVPALLNPQYGLARSVIDDLRADVLVVDHYGMDADFESACRDWAKKIVVIDDLADRIHDCDVLIDQTYGRDADDYKELTPEHCRILAGAEYALLRPQFADVRGKSLDRRRAGLPDRPRVLVSLGSTNIHGITQVALRALQRFKLRPLAIDVVLGASAPGVEEARILVEAMNKEGFHKATYHQNVAAMAGFMAEADLAIGAGGTTSWERCCAGLPVLMVEIADNQRFLAAQLHDAGAAYNLGWYAHVDVQMLVSALETYIIDPESLSRMSQRAAAICDGCGTQRVVDIINSF